MSGPSEENPKKTINQVQESAHEVDLTDSALPPEWKNNDLAFTVELVKLELSEANNRITVKEAFELVCRSCKEPELTSENMRTIAKLDPELLAKFDAELSAELPQIAGQTGEIYRSSNNKGAVIDPEGQIHYSPETNELEIPLGQNRSITCRVLSKDSAIEVDSQGLMVASVDYFLTDVGSVVVRTTDKESRMYSEAIGDQKPIQYSGRKLFRLLNKNDEEDLRDESKDGIGPKNKFSIRSAEAHVCSGSKQSKRSKTEDNGSDNSVATDNTSRFVSTASEFGGIGKLITGTVNARPGIKLKEFIESLESSWVVEVDAEKLRECHIQIYDPSQGTWIKGATTGNKAIAATEKLVDGPIPKDAITSLRRLHVQENVRPDHLGRYTPSSVMAKELMSLDTWMANQKE